MEIYLEVRNYKLKEIAPIIGVNPDRRDLRAGVRMKLNSMGFVENTDYEFPKGKNGIIVILHIPTEPVEKIRYLTRLLGADKQVNALDFCAFVYHLLESEDFQYRPWAERVEWLKDVEGIKVSDKTLRNWANILMTQDTLIKSDDFTWWTSSRDYDGNIIREELADDDQSIEAYKEWNKEFWNREDVKSLDKKIKGERWFSEMWGKFGCKFYKCYAFTFGAWHGEILEELITTYKEYRNHACDSSNS